MVDYKDILEEPVFLVNEYLESGQKEIEKILTDLKKPPFKDQQKAKFLRNYTNLLFNSYRKKRYKTIAQHTRDLETQNILDKQNLAKHLEIKKEELKRKLKLKKEELQSKIEELKKQEEVNQYVEEEQTRKKEALHKELIVSKLTNTPLVTREITDNKYILTEPFLRPQETQIIQELKDQEYNEKTIKDKIKQVFGEQTNIEIFSRIRYFLARDQRDYQKLSPLFKEKDLKEITCNGPNQNIIINLGLRKNLETNITYTQEELNKQIQALAKKTNKEIDNKHPFLDTELPNQFHIQANLGTEFSQPRFVIHR